MAEPYPTFSWEEQHELELRVSPFYTEYLEKPVELRHRALVLLRAQHVAFLKRGLRNLSESHRVLDASRPWLCYWAMHGLCLLGEEIPEDVASDVVAFLALCQDPEGGYGGGPKQIAHLASTYAAVCTLLTLGTDKAFASMNRESMLRFILRMKVPLSDPVYGGGFRMHPTGEVDIRGTYTAIAVAEMLDIKTEEVMEGVGDFVARSQTYEGGMGGEPGTEAHGGYAFCGLATHIMLGCKTGLDIHKLARWAVFRQGSVEGGFMGRTNKLVDGCYSFWMGGLFPLLRRLLPPLDLEGLAALLPAEGQQGGTRLVEDEVEEVQGSKILGSTDIFARVWPAASLG
eukprot:CAMPEP_0118940664 /NCGR_PEP_ID=MMETSP1169-20130426/31998_1 /TAXON_ID=36882 /ORGANISM="Pyramimonas obovata, Strain CCMP722" /LENGTH=342 /DNA_ID=CAMNT_0006885215 /DNA_START=111 /DNA_END=1135 /DNA_ORIENTATION=-